MTTTYSKEEKIIIGDADGLIALISNDDIHHEVAYKLMVHFYETGYRVFFPATAIAETLTTLTRVLGNKEAEYNIVGQIAEGPLKMVDTTKEILKLAALRFYNPKSSKKDTFFDAIVAATAFSYGAKYIYSFDSYYQKVGFRLTKELLQTRVGV